MSVPRDGATRTPSRVSLEGVLSGVASAIAAMPEGEFPVGLGEVGAGTRGDLPLVAEAAQAYAEAYAAGHPEAADRIDEMLAGFRPRAGARCGRVRDVRVDQVLSEVQIRELSRHAARCTTCLAEFAGLLNSVSAALPSGPVSDPFAPGD